MPLALAKKAKLSFWEDAFRNYSSSAPEVTEEKIEMNKTAGNTYIMGYGKRRDY